MGNIIQPGQTRKIKLVNLGMVEDGESQLLGDITVEKERLMLTEQEKRNLDKAQLQVSQLVEDLRQLIKTDNDLLFELGMDMVNVAVELEKKLKRLNKP
jgi:hypothetical protein